MPRKVHTVAVPEALARRAAQWLMEIAHQRQATGTDLSAGAEVLKEETQEYADAQALYKLVRDAKNERKASAPKRFDLDESY